MRMDPEAVTALLKVYVPCHELVNHPSAQVIGRPEYLPKGGKYAIGPLGFLNGIVGVIPSGPEAGHGYITAVYDSDGNLMRFQRTVCEVD